MIAPLIHDDAKGVVDSRIGPVDQQRVLERKSREIVAPGFDVDLAEAVKGIDPLRIEQENGAVGFRGGFGPPEVLHDRGQLEQGRGIGRVGFVRPVANGGGQLQVAGSVQLDAVAQHRRRALAGVVHVGNRLVPHLVVVHARAGRQEDRQTNARKYG